MIRQSDWAVDLSTSPGRKRSTVILAITGNINTGLLIVQGLVLVPLYLHFMGVATYGIWLASGGILGMLGLMNFGISNLLIQRVASEYGRGDLQRTGASFTHGMLINLVICFLYGVAGLSASYWLDSLFDVSGAAAKQLRGCFQIAVVALVIGIINESLQSFCQALLKPLIPMTGMLVSRCVGIAVIVWMLFHDFGLWAIPVGTLVIECMALIFNFIYSTLLFLQLKSGIRLEADILKGYLRDSPALFLGRVGDTLALESEPLLITLTLGPEVNTAYIVTRRAADIVYRMLNVIVGSVMGSFAHLAGSSELALLRSVAGRLTLLSFAAAAVCFATYLGANSAFVRLWVGESLVLGDIVSGLIALGFFACTFRGLVSRLLNGTGDFIYPAIVTLLEGIVRILLMVMLLNLVGVIGVPVAFCIACWSSTLLVTRRLWGQLGLTFNLPSSLRLAFSAMIVFCAAFAVAGMSSAAGSWIEFVPFLGVLMVGVAVLFVLLNFRLSIALYHSLRI